MHVCHQHQPTVVSYNSNKMYTVQDSHKSISAKLFTPVLNISDRWQQNNQLLLVPPPSALKSSTLNVLLSSAMLLSMIVMLIVLLREPEANSTAPVVSV